jgi:hypothetical protein
LTIYYLLFLAAASLVAIATGLSAGTTFITLAALAAVVTALALVGCFSTFLGAVAATGVAFGALTAFYLLCAAAVDTLTRIAALAILAHLAAAILTLARVAAVGLSLGTTFSLGAGSCLLAGSTGALLTSAALSIAGAVAGSVAAATVLASAEFLLGTGAVGFVTALLGLLASFVTGTTASGLSTAEGVHVLLDTCENHLADTLGRQRCTCYAVNLGLSLTATLLDNGKSDLTISTHNGTTDELALELLLLDEGTETGGLALMVEVSTEDLLEVGRHSHITPEATPKAATFQGQDKGFVASGGLSLIDRELLANLLGLDLEGTAFGDLTVGSDDACLLNQFVELRFHVALGDAANVEGSKDLFLLIDSHVGILSRLQRAADEGQQEGYEHHHYGCIADGIDIAVGVNALCFHLLDM